MILTYINIHNGQTLTPTAPYHVTPMARPRDQDVVDPIMLPILFWSFAASI